MKTRLLLPILFIVIAVVVGNQLLSLLNPTVTPKPTPTASSPDFFLNGFTTHTFSEQGQIDNTIRGHHLAYLGEEKISLIQKPELQVLDPEHGTWNLTGEKAAIDADEIMTFQGAVSIIRSPGQSISPASIQTEDLVVDTGSNQAETHAAASLTAPDKTVTATGLKLQFRDPAKIELLADVKAVYE